MAKVTVDHGGRGGDVFWRDGELNLRFVWEGTNGGFEISVPTLAQWTDQTGLPESRRVDGLRDGVPVDGLGTRLHCGRLGSDLDLGPVDLDQVPGGLHL